MEPTSPPAPRHVPRIPLPVERIPRDDARPRFLGYLGNISETGLFVQSTSPPAPGTRVSLRLRLSGTRDEFLGARAVIVWSRGYAGRLGPSAGMGLRLLGLDPDERSAWLRLCAELAESA